MRLKWTFLMLAVPVISLMALAPTAAQNPSHQLAYSNGDIYTVDAESDVVTRLTSNDAYETLPTWSPDGSQIAYTATLTTDFYGQYGLFVMDANGSHQTQIAVDLVWRSQPVWMNDGETILYATSDKPDVGDCIIQSVMRDGTNAHELLRRTHPNCNVANLLPALSPDNSQIIVGFDGQTADRYTQLYSLSLSDGNVRQLTHDRSDHYAAEWSPDGKEIAFTAIEDRQQEIFVMDADGSNLRRVTHRPGDDYAPTWLPDGKHLLFSSDQNGYNVFSVDLTSGVVRNLTNLTDSGAWNMTLSPDGTQIAYVTGRDPVSGPEHMAVMTLATSDVRQLPTVGAEAYLLTWRPIKS